MNEATQARRRPVGAEMVPGVVVEFHVWALGRRKVEVVVEGPARHPTSVLPRSG